MQENTYLLLFLDLELGDSVPWQECCSMSILKFNIFLNNLLILLILPPLLPSYPPTLLLPTLLPSYPPTLPPFYPSTLLPFYPPTLLPFYPTTTLLPFYPSTLLPSYPSTLLPFYPPTLLPFYPPTLLLFYPSTLLTQYSWRYKECRRIQAWSGSKNMHVEHSQGSKLYTRIEPSPPPLLPLQKPSNIYELLRTYSCVGQREFITTV